MSLHLFKEHSEMRKLYFVSLISLPLVLLILIAFLFYHPVYAANYNRTAAGNYADQWAHSRNSYYNSYSNDCANFASQVLAAGGLPQRGWNKYDSYAWFYNASLRVNSNTWSATDWMNQFFSNYSGSDFQLYGTVESLKKGDILLMQLPGNSIPSHARVIVGSGYSQEGVWYPVGTYGLLADQHTDDRKRVLWNDPIPAGTPLWPWHVSW
jgi:hypothetical protein